MKAMDRTATSPDAMDGVIVIDKPSGWTSHDVVARVKAALRCRKVGHLGTLDPLATGVLPLVVDGGAKMARFLDGGPKGYSARVRLGVETDTYDAEGAVVSSADPSGIDEKCVIEALAAFSGRILQTPPMYSSVKQAGTPLYKLARKGVVVERAKKQVEIYSIEMTGFDAPFLDLDISCSKGTYVRSVCHDLGKALGCGAHLAALRRTRAGIFGLDKALLPTAHKDELVAGLVPIDRAMSCAVEAYRSIGLTDEEARRLMVGSTLLPRAGFSALPGGHEMVRFTHGGSPVAIGGFDGEGFKVEMLLGRQARGAHKSMACRV